VELPDPISQKQNAARRRNVSTEESMISYTHRLLMNSKMTISRQKRTTFGIPSFAHYPNRRVGKERHISRINKRKTRMASRPMMRVKIFNIDLGPFQNQSMPWRTSPVLAASLLKLSSDL
jgi:hypothetical protein